MPVATTTPRSLATRMSLDTAKCIWDYVRETWPSQLYKIELYDHLRDEVTALKWMRNLPRPPHSLWGTMWLPSQAGKTPPTLSPYSRETEWEDQRWIYLLPACVLKILKLCFALGRCAWAWTLPGFDSQLQRKYTLLARTVSAMPGRLRASLTHKEIRMGVGMPFE